MKFINKIIVYLPIFFLLSCAEFKNNQTSNLEKKYYTSKGFALIYDESLFIDKVVKRKIKNDKIAVAHSHLKRGTNIKIINPNNSKSLETIVTSTFKYPKIFNLVVSQEVASLLDLDSENPYIELFEIKKNHKFVAKEGSMFEEEKNVATKAPVKKIKMNDLSIEVTEKKKEKKIIKNYIIVISDFYYHDSAQKLKVELISKTRNQNFNIKTINNKKYRLSAGPFKNFNTLKSTYISLNNLGFEELNIYKE